MDLMFTPNNLNSGIKKQALNPSSKLREKSKDWFILFSFMYGDCPELGVQN
jgi:hypothetical protein